MVTMTFSLLFFHWQYLRKFSENPGNLRKPLENLWKIPIICTKINVRCFNSVCTVSAISAGAYPTTFYVMIDIVEGGGRAPPILTSLGWFYHHVRQKVYSVVTPHFAGCFPIVYRGWILGRSPDKSLKSFPPCFSQSPLQLCLENFKLMQPVVSEPWTWEVIFPRVLIMQSE